MPLLRLFRSGNADAELERYLREERLYADLDLLRAQDADPRQSTLERSLYAAGSYFAA